MDVWVVVTLWDGSLDMCLAFDNQHAAHHAFKEHTGISLGDCDKAWDDAKEQGIDYRGHPLLAKWNHRIDAWVVQTTIE